MLLFFFIVCVILLFYYEIFFKYKTFRTYTLLLLMRKTFLLEKWTQINPWVIFDIFSISPQEIFLWKTSQWKLYVLMTIYLYGLVRDLYISSIFIQRTENTPRMSKHICCQMSVNSQFSFKLFIQCFTVFFYGGSLAPHYRDFSSLINYCWLRIQIRSRYIE